MEIREDARTFCLPAFAGKAGSFLMILKNIYKMGLINFERLNL